MSKDDSRFAEIAKEAYYLYQNRGMEPGQEAEDWFKAEAIVMKRYKSRAGAVKGESSAKGNKRHNSERTQK